jgi:hypothetical protein
VISHRVSLMSDPNSLQPGDFGVVKMGGEGGKLIHIGELLYDFKLSDIKQSFQKDADGHDDYEHAFVYVGAGQIVEAEPGGAKHVMNHYQNVLWSSGLLDLSHQERDIIVRSAISYTVPLPGVPYSAADYFALAAYHLKLGILVPGLRDYVATSKHMICSQLVDKAYQAAAVKLFDDNRWNGYVTPGALAELILRGRR